MSNTTDKAIAYWGYDIQQNKILLTREWATIFQCKEEDLKTYENALFWRDKIHPEDLMNIRADLQKHLENKISYLEVKFRVQNQKKEWVFLESKGKVAEWDDDKTPLFINGYARQYTQVEEPLTLQRYKNLMEQVNQMARIGTWEITLDPLVISWNKVTKAIHELPPGFDPTIENTKGFILDSKEKERINTLFYDAIEKKQRFDTEIQITTAKQNKKWVRVVGVPVVVGKKCTGIYGLYEDIDQQKTTRLALAAEEKLFHQTFDNASIGIALVSLEGNWLKINPYLHTMLGYTAQELSLMNFQEITHPDDLHRDLALVEEVLAGKRNSYRIKKRYLHKTGDVISAILSVSLVKDEQGKPLYFISQLMETPE